MKLKLALTTLVTVLALATNPLSAREVERGEWSVRLILQSADGVLQDSYNRLGQLHDATPGFDIYDLPELDQTWAGTYLSVIFYRPEWDVDREIFNTDFRPRVLQTPQEWTFEVRSDDPYRDLSLTWEAKRTKMRYMVLVDLEENVVVPAMIDGVPQVYHFRMNGPVREFAWRLLKKRQYDAVLASENNANETAAAVSARFVAPTTLTADVAKSAATKSAQPQKSGWLPKGWGQGEGKGYQRSPIPDGLPDDPFGD